MAKKIPGERITGFPPVATSDAVVLILGSMPSVASLEHQQYYGLPRNAFWRIMAEIFGVPADRPYAERLAALTANRIALWDVIRSCHRPGSLDSAIDMKTAEPNEFGTFFAAHTDIDRVFFNGRKAEEMYRRAVLPQLGSPTESLCYTTLPSTSPAHAGMRFPEKLRRWKIVKECAEVATKKKET